MGRNAKEAGAQVNKQWLLMDGRQFLVEQVPVNAIVNDLIELPLTAVNSGPFEEFAYRFQETGFAAAAHGGEQHCQAYINGQGRFSQGLCDGLSDTEYQSEQLHF